MKKLLSILFLAVLLLGCFSSSSNFESEKYGFKATFPCSYKSVGEQYGCEGTSFYSVLFSENSESDFAERKTEFKERAQEKSKETHQFSEKQIDGFDAFEYYSVMESYIDDYGDAVIVRREIFISKGDVMIWITASAPMEDGKTPPIEFEKFFDSIKLTK